jgi:hypothetical protein
MSRTQVISITYPSFEQMSEEEKKTHAQYMISNFEQDTIMTCAYDVVYSLLRNRDLYDKGERVVEIKENRINEVD